MSRKKLSLSTISAQVPIEMRHAIDAEAIRQNIKMGKLLREIIFQWLDQQTKDQDNA